MEYAIRNSALDPARVTGWTVAIACNLLVLALLARGAGEPATLIDDGEPLRLPIEWIVPALPPPPAPPEIITRSTRSTPRPMAPTVPQPVSRDPSPIDMPAPMPAGIGSQAAGGLAPAVTDDGEDGNDASEGLAYLEAPAPRYPPEALRRGWQGTVWLRVLVYERGLPIEVEIEQSSGYAPLDRAARDQVRQRWRFQPALQAGRAVPAWGRVPIAFSLGTG